MTIIDHVIHDFHALYLEVEAHQTLPVVGTDRTRGRPRVHGLMERRGARLYLLRDAAGARA